MPEEKLKVGDIVWVNETSAGGKILKHEWEGKIIEILPSGMTKVRDLDDGEIFWRPIRCLEESDRIES